MGCLKGECRDVCGRGMWQIEWVAYVSMTWMAHLDSCTGSAEYREIELGCLQVESFDVPDSQVFAEMVSDSCAF